MILPAVLVRVFNKTVYLTMYLEERVEQLETLAVDHGRQIETIAKGVADLTVTVNHRFDRIDDRFDQIDKRFSQIDERFSQIDERFVQIDERFDRVEKDISELKSDVSELKAGQARLEQTQQLILTILQERLK